MRPSTITTVTPLRASFAIPSISEPQRSAIEPESGAKGTAASWACAGGFDDPQPAAMAHAKAIATTRKYDPGMARGYADARSFTR